MAVKRGERYPSGQFYDPRFDMFVPDLKYLGWSFAEAEPIFIGNKTYGCSFMNVSNSGRGRYSEFDVNVDDAVSDGIPLNVSYKLSFSSVSDAKLKCGYSSLNQSLDSGDLLEISAEGVYDARTGFLCMVGCRTRDSHDSLDCGILLNFQFHGSDEIDYGNASDALVYWEHTLWGDLRSFAGLILDGFLFPQVLLYIFQVPSESAPSSTFLILPRNNTGSLSTSRIFTEPTTNVPVHVNGTYLYTNFYSAAWDIIIPFVEGSSLDLLRKEKKVCYPDTHPEQSLPVQQCPDLASLPLLVQGLLPTHRMVDWSSLCLSFLKGGILSEQFKDQLTDGCELGNKPADVL
ncbi:hypothetical protein POM88_014257 [Heracleum sosnowskyi]|uniref:DUF2921 domain-containing protein n=1 Tax=Heracleum sosnowskyi TaxID=360622 RepID=A0AAD8J2N7_9APIA|nr:hypothetical protein POM88_014257 [Heracleum sosnowskyi]